MTDELRDVSHTPPHDSHNRVQNYYERGSAAVADGGQPSDEEAADEDVPEDEEEAETLSDVDHDPPDGEGTHNVYRRGRTEE